MARPGYINLGARTSAATGATSVQIPWWSGAGSGDVGLLFAHNICNSSWGGTPEWMAIDQGWTELTEARVRNWVGAYMHQHQVFWKRHATTTRQSDGASGDERQQRDRSTARVQDPRR